MNPTDVLGRLHAPEETFAMSPAQSSVDWDGIQTESIARNTGGKVVRQVTDALDGDVTLTAFRFRDSVDDESGFDSALESWRALSDHDHVVGLVDGRLTDDRGTVVTEQMDGGTLGDVLGDADTIVWPDEAVWVTECLCSALQQAHEQGQTHLAIDPRTVQFRETPTESWNMPKLGDWGVASYVRDHPAGVSDWSPAYAAPEQLDSERFGEPGERTDIYRLGAVCYELLTGEPPRATAGYEAITDGVSDSTVRPPSQVNSFVPEALDEPLLTALATDPEQRYQSAAAFQEALAELDLPEAAQTAMTAEEFRQLGGGPGNRGYTEGHLNEQGQVEESWQTRIQSPIDSTPVVAYGTVYVAGQDGTLTAFHADTGKQRWQVAIEEVVDEIQPQRGQEEMFVLQTAPAVGQGRVCVNTTYGVFGFDARDGTKCWEREFTFRGGLTVGGDRVYVPGADELAALALDSGETVWSVDFEGAAGVNDVANDSFTVSDRLELEAEPWDVGRGQDFGNYVGAPAVGEDIVAVSTKRAISAFDVESGEHRWKFPIDSPRPPSIGDEHVYAGDEETVYALDVATGDPQWRKATDYPVVGPPAVDEQTVYVTLNDRSGGVVAYDRTSGNRQWQYSLDEIATQRFPVANAVATDRAVFVLLSSVGESGDDVREIAAIDADTGDQRWRYELGGQAFGPPAVFEDQLVVGNTEYAVTALSTPTERPGSDQPARQSADETAGEQSEPPRQAQSEKEQTTDATADAQRKIDWTQANPFIDLLEDTRNNEIHKDRIDDVLGWPDGKARSVYKDLKANGYVRMDDWGYVILVPEAERTDGGHA